MKRLVIASALVVAALTAAGCGGYSAKGGSGTAASGGSSYGYGGGSRGTTTQSASGSATIAVRNSSLGRILVDGRGMTLYLFEKDTGTTSTCNGSCAHFWPPLTTKGMPKADTGTMAAKLGTTQRTDGTTQVTYDGHPLYYYRGDTKPGDVTGQGLDAFGALWYVLAPGGMAITG